MPLTLCHTCTDAAKTMKKLFRGAASAGRRNGVCTSNGWATSLTQSNGESHDGERVGKCCSPAEGNVKGQGAGKCSSCLHGSQAVHICDACHQPLCDDCVHVCVCCGAACCYLCCAVRWADQLQGSCSRCTFSLSTCRYGSGQPQAHCLSCVNSPLHSATPTAA